MQREHVVTSNLFDQSIVSGKGLLSKLGRKTLVLDERRGTYHISNQPVIRSESVFTTFECETKQLVAVCIKFSLCF